VLKRVLFSSALILAGCAAEVSVEVVSSSATSVTFRFRRDAANEAARRAALYCANLGRTAELRDIGRRGDETAATFDCR
jgi:hypothetical protein